ncbi:MAG: M48 family metallopeptidase [Acidobacteria bacterium]|nr:M48 family metallopeptidase [Acidobacteriota bacterium]
MAQRPAAPAPTTTPEKKHEVHGTALRTYTLPPEKYRQAVAFNRAEYWLYFLGFAYGVLIYLLVLRCRLGAKYRDGAERVSSQRLVQVIVFAPLLLLTVRVLNLPRSAYAHWLVLKYGLSIQGWGSWAWDWTKLQLLLAGFGTFVVWILYGVIRRSPRRWWFYFWLGALPIIVFVVFVEPVVVEPLFYKFEPLGARRPALVTEIEKVIRRGGLPIPPEHMFEMKASEKLKSVNAYVTGIGASKRVVVWDTTLARMNTPQTLLVFGHEMGHYVLGHMLKGMAFLALELLVFLFAGFWLVQGALRRWGARWGIRGVDDWASLPLLLLLLAVFSFVAAPINNAYSRYLEHHADVYGLEVTHGLVPEASQVATQTFQIQGEIDLEDPDPPRFIVFWLYTHPPLNERMIFSQTYDPWSQGQGPQFVK